MKLGSFEGKPRCIPEVPYHLIDMIINFIGRDVTVFLQELASFQSDVLAVKFGVVPWI